MITQENRMCTVVYGSALDESGNDMNMFDRGNAYADLDNASESWRVKATKGNYFMVKYNNAVFTSDTGSTGLGFKKK